MNLRQKIEDYLTGHDGYESPYTKSCEIMGMVKEYIHKFLEKEFKTE